MLDSDPCLVGGEHDVGLGDAVHGLLILHLILVHVAGNPPRQQLRPRLLRPLPRRTTDTRARFQQTFANANEPVLSARSILSLLR